MTNPEFEPTRVTLLERLRTGKDQTAWLEFESTYRAFIFSLILRMGIPNALDTKHQKGIYLMI